MRRRDLERARVQRGCAYDVVADKWIAIQGEGQPEDLGSCAFGAITYDAQGDAVLFHLSGGAGIRIYDPERNAWTASSVPPKVDWKHRTMSGFHAPVLNAHYYHLAGDSDDNGTILVYRYRKATP